MHSIMLIDDNVGLCENLRKTIDLQTDMKVCGIANDGRTAVSMLSELQPDLAVLDIIMPSVDGLRVLEEYQQLQKNKETVFLVLSGVGKDITIKKALELGAEYYIMKPFDHEMLLLRIRQAIDERAGQNPGDMDMRNMMFAASPREISAHSLEMRVSQYLKELGISPHLSGYQFLREAILIATMSNEEEINIARHIYPVIGKKFGATTQRIERSIRNAIRAARFWKEAPDEQRRRYPQLTDWKISNADFVKVSRKYIQ